MSGTFSMHTRVTPCRKKVSPPPCLGCPSLGVPCWRPRPDWRVEALGGRGPVPPGIFPVASTHLLVPQGFISVPHSRNILFLGEHFQRRWCKSRSGELKVSGTFSLRTRATPCWERAYPPPTLTAYRVEYQEAPRRRLPRRARNDMSGKRRPPARLGRVWRSEFRV